MRRRFLVANHGPEMTKASTFTNACGAFGFPEPKRFGNTIPTLDSLKRVPRDADQLKVWM